MDHFFQPLAARGPRSFRIKKTTGHALDHKTFLKKYPPLRWEAIHNNKADRPANAARYNFFHKQHIQVSGILVKRASRYVDFLKHVHNIIFKMHIHLQALRFPEAKSICAAIASSSNVLHACPDLLHDSTPIPLSFKVDKGEFELLIINQSSPIKGLAKLLTCCQFSYNDRSAGLTWHEFFII